MFNTILKVLSLSLIFSNTYAGTNLESLVGRYGHYDIVAYTGKFTGPFKMRSLVISYGLTDYYMKDGELWSQDRFCFSEYVSNIPFLKTIASDEFTRAIIPDPVQLRVQTDDKGVVHINRPETPTLLGVELDSYLSPFPSDPLDPAYIDSDKDGKPGVTVKLNFAGVVKEELYIARKEIFSYVATVRSDKRIIGTVIDRSEQHVISASKKDLVKENNPRQDKDLRKSPLLLVPVDQTLDCDGLKNKRNVLFPKNPNAYKWSHLKRI